MATATYALFGWIFVSAVISVIECQRTQDMMYTTINGASCFRRLNGTHTTGCSSAFGGSVGVIHLIEKADDFNFILNQPPSPPYAVVVSPAHFTRENILNLAQKAAGHVSAIVLINNRTGMDHFSQESRCPNQYGILLRNQTCDVNRAENSWNPFGTGLLHENFPFPIHYVKDKKDIQNIRECFVKFNGFNMANQHKRSLCSIQIKSFMSAALNSQVCIRRTNYMNNVNPIRFCDPLQGKNVYATIFPRDIVNPENRTVQSKEKIILVTARLDTTSMFDGVGIGALDSTVPLVTLITTAHTLSKMLPKRMGLDNPNVLFILFNGESYDYIGSQRFVYDVEKELFPPKSTATNPISLDNILLHIDIGSLDDINSIWLYQYTEFNQSKQLRDLLTTYNQIYDLSITTTKAQSYNLPPTSAQTFLRDNSSFPSVILYRSDRSAKQNHFFHSVYDDIDNVDFQYFNRSQDFVQLIDHTVNPYPKGSIQTGIRNLSSLLAFSLYELVTNSSYTGSLASNPDLVDELLHCYLQSADCAVFRAASKPGSTPGQPVPPQRYISVQGSLTYETIGWTYRVFGFLISQTINATQEQCNALPLMWFSGVSGQGECHRSTQNVSDAQSPAFLIEDYDWASGRYSTWTESTWREISARIFLKPSVAHESLTLSIGFVVLLISFIVVFLFNSKSDILFGDSTSSAGALAEPANCWIWIQ